LHLKKWGNRSSREPVYAALGRRWAGRCGAFQKAWLGVDLAAAGHLPAPLPLLHAHNLDRPPPFPPTHPPIHPRPPLPTPSPAADERIAWLLEGALSLPVLSAVRRVLALHGWATCVVTPKVINFKVKERAHALTSSMRSARQRQDGMLGAPAAQAPAAPQSSAAQLLSELQQAGRTGGGAPQQAAASRAAEAGSEGDEELLAGLEEPEGTGHEARGEAAVAAAAAQVPAGVVQAPPAVVAAAPQVPAGVVQAPPAVAAAAQQLPPPEVVQAPPAVEAAAQQLPPPEVVHDPAALDAQDMFLHNRLAPQPLSAVPPLRVPPAPSAFSSQAHPPKTPSAPWAHG